MLLIGFEEDHNVYLNNCWYFLKIPFTYEKMIELPIEIQVHIATCTRDLEVFKTCLLVSKNLSVFVRSRTKWFKEYFNHKKVITLLRENDKNVIPTIYWIPGYCQFIYDIKKLVTENDIRFYRKTYHRTNGTYNTSSTNKPPITIYAKTSKTKYILFHGWYYEDINGNAHFQRPDVQYIRFNLAGFISKIKFIDNRHACIPEEPHYNYITEQYKSALIVLKEEDKHLIDEHIYVYATNYSLFSLMNGMGALRNSP